MGGEGDGLIAVERLGAADVVAKDPVLLAPERDPWLCRLVVTGYRGAEAVLGQMVEADGFGGR